MAAVFYSLLDGYNSALTDRYVLRPLGRFGRLKLKQVRYFETSGSDYVLTQRRDVSYPAEKTSKLVHSQFICISSQQSAVWQHSADCKVFLLQVLV